MKKRFIACLSLLLLLSTLLCSCAAGLPGHALLTAMQNGIGGFTSNLSNLLKDNVPIVIDGNSDYAILRSVTASDQVKDAISEFCGALQKKSGFDLAAVNSKTAKHRILIGDTGEAASNDVKTALNAANFYIGFSGKDLVVQAANDMMLAAALHYLATEFVQGEQANAGEGYFFLPYDLAYTAPTLLCTGAEYNIIRAENTSERAVNSIARLHEVISTTAGVRISLKSDMLANNDEHAKEILVGTPNRPECKEILASLQYNEYYIGTVNNKMMILANSEPMLELAVEDFLATFVTSANAEFDTSEKTLTLPTHCARRYTADTKLLAKGGLSNAVLIYPDGASAMLLSAIEELKNGFHALTNATLPAISDKQQMQSAEGKIEILLGATNRKQSTTAIKNLKAGEWRIFFDGDALVVAAKDDVGLLLALEQLSQKTRTQTASLANDWVFDWNGNPISGVSRLLYFPANLRLSGVCAPSVPSFTSWLRLTDSSYIIYRKNCQQAALNSYLVVLDDAGYTKKTSSTVGEVSTAVYYTGDLIITVTYSKADKTLRVITDNRAAISLPTLPEELSERTDIEPLYAQLDGIYQSSDSGILHVMRLCNGTFIIVNGGNGNADQAAALLSFLKSNNVLGGKPIISCWILTDGLGFSVTTFAHFALQLAGQVQLQSVLYSPICDAQTSSGKATDYAWRASTLLDRIHRFGNDVRVYKARTGMRYAFAGCEIDMLLTLEDYPIDYRLDTKRDASAVMRITLAKGNDNAQSILLLSNLSQRSAEMLIARYGSKLKSDVVQCPSINSLKDATATKLYSLIAAPVVLWPAAKSNASGSTKYYDNPTWNSVTRTMLEQEYAKVCYVACRGTEALTLAQLKAGAEGKVFGNGLTAANAATGTTETPGDANATPPPGNAGS